MESSAIINLRGVSTKLNKYIVFAMQTYKELSPHVCRHAFFRSFYAQAFVPMCQIRYFNHTFDRRHYSNRTIAYGLCFFGSVALLKIIPLVAPGILSTFFQCIIITH